MTRALARAVLIAALLAAPTGLTAAPGAAQDTGGDTGGNTGGNTGGLSTYRNERHGFSVSYPTARFVALPAATEDARLATFGGRAVVIPAGCSWLSRSF